MYKEGGRTFVAGTVSKGGWTCTDKGEGIPTYTGKNFEITDQWWNSVSAQLDWISKVMKGSNVELCKLKNKEQI